MLGKIEPFLVNCKDTDVCTLLVDAHVHIYDCFDVEQLLDSALHNFNCAAKKIGSDNSFIGVLLLAETRRDNWFMQSTTMYTGDRWQIRKTQEAVALKASLQTTADEKNIIYIMSGRQIVTAEGIELLALVTDSRFEDGLPAAAVLSDVRKQDAIPVLPWAVGKWLGKRGRILSTLLQAEARNELFLGDNSGRPVFWYDSVHFRQARTLNIPILPGTDPLPISGEESRVGSFGFSLRGRLSELQPATDLKRLLRTNETIQAYGQLEKTWRFFVNQVRLRRL